MVDPGAMQQMMAMPPEAQAPVAPPMPPGPGMSAPMPMGAPPGPGSGPMGPRPGPGMGPGMGPPPDPPKKPPLLLPPRLAKQLARGYVDAARQNAKLISDFTGPPDEFERFPIRQQVEAWHKRDIRQDPYALREQGMSDVEIRDKVYPLRRILLKMVGPGPTDRAKFAARMRAERDRTDRIEGESPP